jgi:hypothetical protein
MHGTPTKGNSKKPKPPLPAWDAALDTSRFTGESDGHRQQCCHSTVQPDQSGRKRTYDHELHDFLTSPRGDARRIDGFADHEQRRDESDRRVAEARESWSTSTSPIA